MSPYIVITTIQAPTPSVLEMHETGTRNGVRMIAIGDRKSPMAHWPDGIDFLDLPQQHTLRLSLPALLPENHYARKNIGYLLAISRNAPFIFDTDDDNSPLPSWRPRALDFTARACLQSGWVNAYRWFSDEHVWPRGLPLTQVRHAAAASALGSLGKVKSPIQQGLANGSPDVDAVWRLLMDKAIEFRDADSVFLPAGTWCPFNSQSTWWFPQAYPLLYLPSYVSFRMTDIWRSFVAQRCLWPLGCGVSFHSAEMHQDRNPHHLLRDFEQEVPGYLANDYIRRVLESVVVSTRSDAVAHNLRQCYAALIDAKLVPAGEMDLVECWLRDLAACTQQP
jgi:hypothetical protein